MHDTARFGEGGQDAFAERRQAFTERVLGDQTASLVTMMAALGDRLGLFKELARRGPATSGELAERAGIQERYAREWLAALENAGYLSYDPPSGRFALPDAHAAALADEGGPFFLGGPLQMLGSLSAVLDRVSDAFRSGGGVPQSAYPVSFWEGMERFTAGWFEHLLVDQWVAAVPELQERLERGALVADVGCGRGRALRRLARAFPRSRFVGYDVFAPNVEAARGSAQAAGVADRVRFETRDASAGLPERYDAVFTFDVVHDAVDPVALLRSIRRSLADDGIYVCLDINCSDKLEDNHGPLGALFHSVSTLYCMTTSLAEGGLGLGAMGLPEPKLRELAGAAGFREVRKLPIEDPFNNLYELRP